MVIYFICFFSIGIIGLLKFNKKLKAVFICGILIALFSLRSIEIGVDIHGYVDNFHIIADTDWSQLFDKTMIFHNYDKGFIVFDKLVSYITQNDQWYLFICACIIYIPLVYFFYKETCANFSANMYFFLCLPSFLVCLSGLRQAIAVSLSLMAYLFFNKKRFLISACFYVISIFFHLTALIGILLLIGSKIRLKKKHVPFVILFSIVIFLLRFTIINDVFLFLSNYSDKVEHYEIENTAAYTFLLVYVLMVFISYFFVSKENESDERFLIHRNMLVMVMLIQIFASTQSNLSRVTFYFIPFIPLVLQEVIGKGVFSRDKNSMLILNFVLYSACTILFVYMLFVSGVALELVPYEFYWAS